MDPGSDIGCGLMTWIKPGAVPSTLIGGGGTAVTRHQGGSPTSARPDRARVNRFGPPLSIAPVRERERTEYQREVRGPRYLAFAALFTSGIAPAPGWRRWWARRIFS